MRLHENSARLGMETKYLFKSTVNIKKNNGLLNSFCSSILSQLESSNFWEFWRYFQDDGTFVSKLPTFKTLFAFVILTLFKLPDPGASIYVQSLLKFSTRGAQGRSKSSRRPVVPPPPLGHNIDSCITQCFNKVKVLFLT